MALSWKRQGEAALKRFRFQLWTGERGWLNQGRGSEKVQIDEEMVPWVKQDSTRARTIWALIEKGQLITQTAG